MQNSKLVNPDEILHDFNNLPDIVKYGLHNDLTPQKKLLAFISPRHQKVLARKLCLITEWESIKQENINLNNLLKPIELYPKSMEGYSAKRTAKRARRKK